MHVVDWSLVAILMCILLPNPNTILLCFVAHAPISEHVPLTQI